MRYHIPFGEFGTNCIRIVIFGIIGCVFIAIGFSYSAIWAFVVGGISISIVYLSPIAISWDVKDRIPEIAAMGKKLKEDDKISHPYFWVIVIITLFFGATLLGWAIAFFWALSPGDVTIPEHIAKKLQSEPNTNNKQNIDSEHIQSSNESENKDPSLDQTRELEKIEEMFKKSLINEEERNKMRAKVLGI